MQSTLLALLALGAAAALSSCGGSRYIAHHTPASTIDELALFRPFALVGYIDKGNRILPSDSMSSVTAALLDSTARAHGNRLRIDTCLDYADACLGQAVFQEIDVLTQRMRATKNKGPVPISPVLDSLLESRGYRYGMTLVATGHGRRKGNYGGQVAKSAAVGILTLGMYVPIPIKADLTLYALIVDSERDEVVFSDRTLPYEKSPPDPRVVEDRLTLVFEDYYFPARSHSHRAPR